MGLVKSVDSVASGEKAKNYAMQFEQAAATASAKSASKQIGRELAPLEKKDYAMNLSSSLKDFTSYSTSIGIKNQEWINTEWAKNQAIKNNNISSETKNELLENWVKIKTMEDLGKFFTARGYQKEFQSILNSVNSSLEAIISSGKDAFLDMRNLLGDQFRDTLQKLWEKLDDAKEKDVAYAKDDLALEMKENGATDEKAEKESEMIVSAIKEAQEAGASMNDSISEIYEQTQKNIRMSLKDIKPRKA